MAPTIEGFETGAVSQTQAQFGTWSITSAVKNTGTYSLLVNPTTTGTGGITLQSIGADGAISSSNNGPLFCTFMFRPATLPASLSENCWRLRNPSNALKCLIRINSTGNFLYFNRSLVLQATGTEVLSTSAFNRIDIWTIQDCMVVMINGVVDFVSAAIDVGTASNWGFLHFGKDANTNGQSVAYYFDDIWMDTERWPSNGGVYVMLPDGGSTPHDWTVGTGSSDYTTVDEIPTNGDTDYMASSGSAGQNSWVTLQSCAAAGIPGGATIESVQAVASFRKLSGTSSTKVQCDSSASTTITTGKNIATTYAYTNLLIDVDPATSKPFTQAGLDALKIGIQESNAVVVRCSSLMAQVWAGTAPSYGSNYLSDLSTLQSPTVAGLQVISGIPFQPKGALVLGCAANPVGTYADTNVSIGAATERGKRFAFGDFRGDNLAAADVNPAYSATAFIRQSKAAAALRMEAHIIEWTSDGLVLFWPTPDSVARDFFLLLFGGDACDVAVGSTLSRNTNGSQVFTGTGFTPNVVIGATGVATGTVHLGIGVATSTSERWANHSFETDGSNPTVTKSIQKTDKFLIRWGNAASQFEADLTTFDTNGFTAAITTGGVQHDLGWIALKVPFAKAHTMTQPTSVSTVSTTSLAFKPKTLLLSSHGFASGSSQTNDGKKVIGLATATQNRSIAMASKHNVTPSQAATRTSSTKCFSYITPGVTPSVDVEADLTTFLSNGYDLDFTTVDATAREILVLALGGYELADLTTTAASSITTTTASSGGNITADNGTAVTARGVCWSTTPGPTVADNTTSDGTGSGSFSSSLTSLIASTTYYVRAYATNLAGVAYGAEISFITSGAAVASNSNLLLLGVG